MKWNFCVLCRKWTCRKGIDKLQSVIRIMYALFMRYWIIHFFFFLENRLIPRSPSYTQLTHLDRKEINKRKCIRAVLVVKSLKKNENIIWLNSWLDSFLESNLYHNFKLIKNIFRVNLLFESEIMICFVSLQ